MLDGRQAQQALNTYNFAVVSMLKFSLFALVEARVARAFQRGLLGKTWNFLEITDHLLTHGGGTVGAHQKAGAVSSADLEALLPCSMLQCRYVLPASLNLNPG